MDTPAPSPYAGRPVTPDEIQNIKNLFVLYGSNRAFLRGRSLNVAGHTGSTASQLVIILGLIVVGGCGGVAIVASNSFFSWMFAIVLFILFAVLYRWIRRVAGRNQEDIRQAKVLIGTVSEAQVRRQSNELVDVANLLLSSGKGYRRSSARYVHVKFTVTSPSGAQLSGARSAPAGMFKGAPEAGTPVAVLYWSEERFELL